MNREYFEEIRTCKRNVILLPIGIPGSGKSYSTRWAGEYGWEVISSDSLRHNYLVESQRHQNRVVIDGKTVDADPDSPKQIFSKELREWVNNKLLHSLREALSKRNNIVLDVTNVSLHRVLYMNMARENGYIVDAVVFNPNSDLDVHVDNVLSRVKSGGVGLASDGLNRESTMEVIRKVYNAFNCFSSSLKVDPAFSEISRTNFDNFDFSIFKEIEDGETLQDFLNKRNGPVKDLILELYKYDIFNSIFFEEVRRF